MIKIYCEGKKNGHDYDVLRKVVLDLNVHIQPIGDPETFEFIPSGLLVQ